MKGCGYSGCLESAAFNRYGIDLCLEHALVLHNTVRVEVFSKKVSKMFDAGSLSQHSPGITYIIQLPNLDIKIGTTKDGKSLSRRLMSLGRQFRGRPTLLATLPGGETQEAVLHARFAEHRRYDKLDERFRPAAEIFFFAKEVGLEEEGKLGLQAFESWQYVPGTVVEPHGEDRKYLAVSCADCGAEENEPCMWKAETIEAIHASRKSRLSYLLMP